MNIQKLIFILCNFTLVHIYCAQIQKENCQKMRKNLITQTMQDYSFLTKTFDFLHKYNDEKLSFYDFLEQNLSYDENNNEGCNLDIVIEAAENYIVRKMNDHYKIISEDLIHSAHTKHCLHDYVYTYFIQNKHNPILYEFLQRLSRVSSFSGGMIYNNIYMLQLLIPVGLDLNCRNCQNCYPLDYAIQGNDQEIAQMLINSGVDINCHYSYGNTPLHKAAMLNRKEIVLMLINAGADVNSKNNIHKTPLHYAAEYNFKDVARLLVVAGADIHIQDDCHQKPENIARTAQMRAILKKEEMICCSIS